MFLWIDYHGQKAFAVISVCFSVGGGRDNCRYDLKMEKKMTHLATFGSISSDPCLDTVQNLFLYT